MCKHLAVLMVNIKNAEVYCCRDGQTSGTTVSIRLSSYSNIVVGGSSFNWSQSELLLSKNAPYFKPGKNLHRFFLMFHSPTKPSSHRSLRFEAARRSARMTRR